MEQKIKQTFTKEERLSSKKIIEQLSQKGNSFFEYPFKVIWLKTPLQTKYPVQIVIGVPKRNFKKAVDRNKIRRRIKEAYRKNKNIIYNFLEEKKIQCALMLVYTAKTEIEYKEIESKIILTLQRLTGKVAD